MLYQCTKFGAMLDQLTDRAATSMLLMALSVLYPKYVVWYVYFSCKNFCCETFFASQYMTF